MQFWVECIFLYQEIAAMCHLKVAFGEALSIIPSNKWLSSWLWDIGSISRVISGSVALWGRHNGKEISYSGGNLCRCGWEALLWLGRWLAEEVCIQIKAARLNKSKLYWYHQSIGYAHFSRYTVKFIRMRSQEFNASQISCNLTLHSRVWSGYQKKKTSMLCTTGHLWREFTAGFHTQRGNNAESVSMSWYYHLIKLKEISQMAISMTIHFNLFWNIIRNSNLGYHTLT